MAVTSRTPLETIVAAWDAAGLDAVFIALRVAGANLNDQVLHDTQAKPGTPFPYCVFSQIQGGVVNGRTMDGLEFRTTRLVFTVWARSKPQAAELSEQIVSAIEGPIHSTGCILNVWFVDDFGGRNEGAGNEEEWYWTAMFDVQYEAEVNACQ